MNGRHLAALLALAALAAASVWLLTGTGAHPDRSPDPRGPAWYFDGARLLATGDAGEVLYQVEAPRIEHDPADDSALLSTPVMRWLHGDAPPLVIRAERGRAHAQGAWLRLEDGVSLVDESSGSRLEFHAPWLEVDAIARTVHTSADIVVLTEGGEMRGTGLLADMNGGTISIGSSVRARYVR